MKLTSLHSHNWDFIVVLIWELSETLFISS